MAQTLDLQKLDALLIQVQAYDWGASREPLMQYTDLERAAYQDPAMVRLVEKKLLTLLKSNASLAAKQFVCQRLSVIGSEASAPTLSKMLKDEKTADMARYALERIPGKKITDALHKALGSSRGLTRIGIINTLGQRAEAGSAAALIKLLNHSDPAVVAASASALGKIGTLAAVAALEQALPKMKTDLLPTALQAMLQAADKLAQTGNASAALTLYKKLQAPDYAAPIRAAALSGQVVTDQAHSQEILLNTLQNADDNQKSMAITLLSRLPAEVKMAPFAALMSRLPAELKVQMLTALAVRGDRSVLSSAVAAVGDADTAVRIA
ncbi:MAG TPA: HEAT repeat domain-containing protein, partial [bacterium]|nr:HEAT repeat domain-containing protein [bacterium]